MKSISYTGGQLAQAVNLINQQKLSSKAMDVLLRSRALPQALRWAEELADDPARFEFQLGSDLCRATHITGPDGGGGGAEREIINYAGIHLPDVLDFEPRPVAEFIAECDKRYSKLSTRRSLYAYRFNARHTVFDIAELWKQKDRSTESLSTLGGLLAMFGQRVGEGGQAVAGGSLAWYTGGILVAPCIREKGICLVPVALQFEPLATSWVYEDPIKITK